MPESALTAILRRAGFTVPRGYVPEELGDHTCGRQVLWARKNGDGDRVPLNPSGARHDFTCAGKVGAPRRQSGRPGNRR